jgi:ABC-type branched-subunit amino acid transport system substrate-binding protein
VDVPGQRTTPSPRRVLLTCALLVVSAVLAGCGGSSIKAREALAANAAVNGRVGGSATTDSTSTPQQTTEDDPVVSTTEEGGKSHVLALSGKHDGHAASGGSSQAATGGKRIDCTGFHNQTGITDSTVTLANIADISGPVPGIFTSAQQATKAYVAYFNATSSLCGRKLQVLGLDSRTDAGGDQIAYVKACEDAFAAVGSMSAFDSGGAETAQGCGLPDLRSQAVSDARNACRTCFGVQATQLNAFQNAVPDFFLDRMHEATQHAGMIYVSAAASVDNAKHTQAAEERRGMHFVYSAPFDIAEFNYSPYVQRMKQAGVRWLQFVGSPDQAVRMARAMQDNAFKPDAFVLDATAYDRQFAAAGSAVDGSYVYVNFTPLEEAASNAELRLYEQWLQQVAPGATPTYFGIFAWSAARLFVEQAVELGGRLTRANLVARLHGIHAWTGNGLHAPQDVGGKTNGNCWRFLQLHDGHWRAVGGTKYLCHGATVVG